jgi:hypothetical protein
MSKSGHKSSKQIVWKCVTVQIFGNDSNNLKFDSGGTEEEIEFWLCLLPFCPEPSVFLSAIEKRKN